MHNLDRFYQCNLPFNPANFQSLNKALKSVLKAGYNVVEPYKVADKKAGIIRHVAPRTAIHEVSYRWEPNKMIFNCGPMSGNNRASHLIADALRIVDSSCELKAVKLPEAKVF